MEYDSTGVPISQQVTANGQTTLNRQYKWNEGNRLASTLNVLTKEKVRHDYDSFGSLVAAKYNEKETVFKNPDEVGNLYRTKDRSDRKYGGGGKLLKDPDWFYHYDALGNLILKTKSITSDVVWQRGNWAYHWLINGMLQNVTRPDGSLVEFEYDALGRRTAKIADGIINRYVWDGNLLLHERSHDINDRPRLVVKEKGQLVHDTKELAENVTTWVYDDSSFTPSAKLVGGKQYSIIADYLGTPVEAYDEAGNKKWYREIDCYGQVRKGDNAFIPFLYQGQYWDEETGLAYNRFRYYDCLAGTYINPDPAGLLGGLELYNYVEDTTNWIDPFGLNRIDWTNGWRTADGKFASPQGGGVSGQGAVDAVKTDLSDKGWTHLGDELSVRNKKGQLRRYDLVFKKPDRTIVGVEVKSNTASKTKAQRVFDKGVSKAKPAKGVGKFKGQQIEEVSTVKKVKCS